MRYYISAVINEPSYVRFFADTLQALSRLKMYLTFFDVNKIHLNLKFIGSDISDDSYKSIIDEMGKLEHQYPRPSVRISNLNFGFRMQTNPSLLYYEVEKNREMIELSSVVHRIVKKLNLVDTIKWKEQHAEHFILPIAKKKKERITAVNNKIRQYLATVNLQRPKEIILFNIHVIGISEVKGSTQTRILNEFIL